MSPIVHINILYNESRINNSTVSPEPCVVNLEATAVLNTVDYHGNARTNGGDPIKAEIVRTDNSGGPTIPTTIDDREDGTYFIRFRPPTSGK